AAAVVGHLDPELLEALEQAIDVGVREAGLLDERTDVRELEAALVDAPVNQRGDPLRSLLFDGPHCTPQVGLAAVSLPARPSRQSSARARWTECGSAKGRSGAQLRRGIAQRQDLRHAGRFEH